MTSHRNHLQLSNLNKVVVLYHLMDFDPGVNKEAVEERVTARANFMRVNRGYSFKHFQHKFRYSQLPPTYHHNFYNPFCFFYIDFTIFTLAAQTSSTFQSRYH